MANISTKVNLGKLRGSKIVTNKAGVKGIFIPIEDNNLYINEEKGNVYLDLISIPLKQKREDSKDTHLVLQSLPQEKQREDDAILGNTIQWGEKKASSNTVQDAVVVEEDDDIPF